MKQSLSTISLFSAFLLQAAVAQTGVTRLRRRRSRVPATEPVEYECTFTNLWLGNRHPVGFPASRAHFTNFVIASHNSDYTMFAPGMMATTGVEELAEEGSTSDLWEELDGTGAAVFFVALSEDEIDAPLTYSSSTTISGIRVNGSHPMLSAMSMIAPSPDWFSGMYNLNMVRNGQTYFSDIIVDLAPWDAGTESGDAFTLGNPAENPQQPISYFRPDNVPENGAFLSPEGTAVLPVLNLHCFMTSPTNNKNELTCNTAGEECEGNRDCRCRRNVCRPLASGTNVCLACLQETQPCTRNGECCSGLKCRQGACA